jgi:hypothetical protein
MRKFYFDTGSTIILLNTREVSTEISTMPHPLHGENLVKLPDLSFKSTGLYEAEDISGTEVMYMMLKNLAQNLNIDKVIEKYQNEIPMDAQEEGVLDALQSISWMKFLYYAKGVGIVFGIIGEK